MRFMRVAGMVMAMLFASVAFAADGPVTFNNQIVRILQQRCQSCHRPENIAPFSLLTYQDVISHAFAVRSQVEARTMPPWKPIDPPGKFQAERRLTDNEIQTILKWIDEGMAEGSPADLPEPIKFPVQWTYSEPDAIVQPDVPYELNPAGGEVYRCFTMPVNSATDLNVRGYEVLPGNREIVHHVLLFIDTAGLSQPLDAADPGPGYTCFGGPGFIPTSALGGWVPGMTPEIFPLGLGVTVPANSRIVMQVHYSPASHGHSHTTGTLEPDTTRIGMFLSPAKLRQVQYVPVVNPFFTIPAGNPRFLVTATQLIPITVELTAVTPHMHLLGREVLVEARFPDGTLKELVHITDWDFNWQGTYTLKQPMLLPAGTIVTSKAWYDNSSDNPRNPSSPPIAVRWGERTTDEMCLTFLSVTTPGSRPMTTVPFSIGERGGMAVNGTGESNTVTVGYGGLIPRANQPSAEGLAIFGFRQNGILVTETAVPAAVAVDRGRVFAEMSTSVHSGIAIANPNLEDVSVSFTFVDGDGRIERTSSTNVPGKTQIAKYLSESPFDGPASFLGSFSFTSSRPVSVVALRETINERGESLLTTLPVSPVLPAGAPPSGSASGALAFPHFADGGGWQTQILLVNPSEIAIAGLYRFYNQNGEAIGTPLPYSVAPNSAASYQTPGTATAVSSGSVQFTPAADSATPSGSLVFSLRNQGVRVTEAGVPAMAEARAFRVYVESSDNGVIQSGVAIANPGAVAATAVMELSNMDGSSSVRTTATIPANGQIAAFLSQIPGLESVRLPFQGLLRISSTSNLVATGLRGRYNERADFLLAATPPAIEGGTSTGEKFFPHFVDGGGYTTQFIIFSSANEPNSGTLSFYAGNGLPATLNVR